MPLTEELYTAYRSMGQRGFQLYSRIHGGHYDILDTVSDKWQDGYLKLREELGGDGLEIMDDDCREELRRIAKQAICEIESIPPESLTPECVKSLHQTTGMAREMLAELDGGPAEYRKRARAVQADSMMNPSRINRTIGDMEQMDYQLTSAVRYGDYKVAAMFADYWKEYYLKIENELSGAGPGGLEPRQRQRIRRMAKSVAIDVERIPAGTLNPRCRGEKKDIHEVGDFARGILVEYGER